MNVAHVFQIPWLFVLGILGYKVKTGEFNFETIKCSSAGEKFTCVCILKLYYDKLYWWANKVYFWIHNLLMKLWEW